MSYAYDAELRLEEERKRQLELEAARERKDALLKAFDTECEKIQKSDGVDFVKEEFSDIKAKIAHCKDLIDPEIALKEAEKINLTIYTLRSLGENLKAEYERQEELKRLRKLEQEKKNRNELFNEFYARQENLNDEKLLSFIKEELAVLTSKIESNGYTASIEQNKKELNAELEKAFALGKDRKTEWEKAEYEKAQRKNLLAQIEEFTASIKEHRIDADKKESFIKELNELKNVIPSGTDFDSYNDTLNGIKDREQTEVVNEKTRRLAVKSIKNMLESHGFQVSAPKLKKENGENFVSIIAQQLSSEKTAEFNIALDGKIHYQLLHYEGLTCTKEFDRIEADLDSIYSFKIENKKDVGHNNPDRISKNAKELPGSAGMTLKR